MFLSFDGAAGLPLLQLGIETFVVVPTPTDYRHQRALGVGPEHLVGVIGWGGLEEGDYKRIDPGIQHFVTADPTASHWHQKVIDAIASLSPGLKVIPVFDAKSFMSGLEELGIPGVTIERALQSHSDTQATLALMD